MTELYLYKVVLAINDEVAIGEICAKSAGEATDTIEREYGASNISAITIVPQRSNIHEISSTIEPGVQQVEIVFTPEQWDEIAGNGEADPDEDLDDEENQVE